MGYNSGRGGKREGAGRPTAPPTKVMRIATDLSREQLEAALNLLDEYEEISEKSSPTSPRFERLREMLNKYKAIKNG
jgi:hypothetical protein